MRFLRLTSQIAALFLCCIATAQAVNVRVTLELNPDGVRSELYPCVLADRSDCAPPTVEALNWATIDRLTITAGATDSINLRSLYLTGTAAGSAALDTTCSPTLAGNISETANGLSWASATTYSGLCATTATDSGDVALSNQYIVEVIAAPSSDTAAPTIPGDLTLTGGSGNVTFQWRASHDPNTSGSTASGVDEYDLRCGSTVVNTRTAQAHNLSPALTATTIGSAGSPTANQSGTNWTLTARGLGFTGTSDNGLFLGAQVSGDFTVTLKVASVTGSTFPQVGPMVRESLSADSVFGFYFQSGDTTTGSRVRTRAATGASVTAPAVNSNQATPRWLRINRTGNVFTFSQSADGQTWTSQASPTIAMPQVAYVGVGMTSVDASNTATGEIEQLAFDNVELLSYQHTTASQCVGSVRARDVSDNNSGYSVTATASPTAPPAAAIRWHPGHYLKTGSNGGNTAQLEKVEDSALILGADVLYRMSQLESTQGNYTWTPVDTDINYLAARGKKLMVQILERNFHTDNSNDIVPDYLEPNLYQTVNGYGLAIWRTSVMDRLIAMAQAFCARYDANPALEAIRFPTETSPALNGVPTEDRPADFTREKLASELKRLYTATKAACPHTNVVMSMNNLSGQEEGLLTHAYDNRMGFGTPDCTDDIGHGLFETLGYPTKLMSYCIASSPVLNGSEGEPDSPVEVINFAQDPARRATHMSWYPSLNTVGKTWAAILVAIGNDPTLYTTCPTQYAACDTN